MPRPTTSGPALYAGLCLLAACNGEPTQPLDPPALAASISTSPSLIHLALLPETPILTTVPSSAGDVTVYNTGLGSAAALVPGTDRDFYLMTDRGANWDCGIAGQEAKGFADPGFTPRIRRYHLSGDKLRAVAAPILLRDENGTPISGRPPAGDGNTGEIPYLADCQTLGTFDPNGLDTEGLAPAPDGTFWVSDEYGPFIVRFAADGRTLEKLGPFDGGIPALYATRRPNRGMEGLTLTPDGQWLVGVMQSPLFRPDNTTRNQSLVVRILFRRTGTGEFREYLYLLEHRQNIISEIVAIDASRFLVLERDGLGVLAPAAVKRIYEIDLSAATDVHGVTTLVPCLPRKALCELDELRQGETGALAAAGIVPVTKNLTLDLLLLGYPHDKPEGIALAPGNMLFVANDDDFGVTDEFAVKPSPKTLFATGTLDFVSFWQVRLGR